MASLRYPYAMIDANTDYLKIEVIEYKAVGFSTTGANLTSSKVNYQNKKILDTIILPIPQNIQDSNTTGWGDDSINNLAAFGIGQVGNFIESEGLVKGLEELLRGAAQGIGQVAVNGGAQNMSTAFFSSKAINILGGNTSFSGVLARSSGQILNPNTELLFNGVKLRTFNFSFDFAPRNATEAEQVKQIMRTFKKNMAPEVTSSGSGVGAGLFLKSPNVFQLTYMSGANQHPFLNKFIISALTNMQVNYTGSGTYMTYSDSLKSPVHMKMDLSFQELSPVYAEDYDNTDVGGTDGTTGVGY